MTLIVIALIIGLAIFIIGPSRRFGERNKFK